MEARRGKGFGIMKRAIEEQRENAAENPITAAASQKSNIENLLDIDFDGAAPASAAITTPPGGLADLMGSPEAQGSNMNDLFGLGMGGGAGCRTDSRAGYWRGCLAAATDGSKKTNQDILGLF